ncbi:MAG: type II secretion system F family protein [Candidatus Diapherotrites archaeon]|nr:type II secretion system F family protein [Candidatus Diapherotrites archaeon]
MKLNLLNGISIEQKSFSVKAGILCGIVFLLIHSLLIENLIEGTALSFLAFVISTMLISIYFKRKEKKRIEAVEAQLPFALLPLGSELNAGIEFEKGLRNASKNSGKELEKEIEFMMNEINNGKPIQKALLEFAKRNNSMQIKKAMSMLSGIYMQGNRNSGAQVKKIAKEMLLKQKNKSKEFSQKIVLYSLVFISVSAIIPAFFQAFITVGSLFMEIDFTPIQVLAITAIIFPLIDLVFLFIIKESTPVHLSE